MLVPLLLMTLAAAPVQRVPVLPLSAGDGVSANTAQALTQALASELRQRPGLEVLTSSELGAVLGMARQRELLGCEAASCRAEVGGALEADLLVAGQLSKVGESWLMTVQLLDGHTAKTLSQSMRRQKGGSIDGLLDVLPAMAQELFPAGGMVVQASGSKTAPTGATLPAASSETRLSPPWAVEPLAAGTIDAKKLVVATDGKGAYVAAIPGYEGPLFAGDAKGLFLQRLFGGGSDGEGGFSMSFWDPRARVPAEGSFVRKDGTYVLTCGKKELTLKALDAKATRTFLSRAKLNEVRWRRRGHGLARDDEGVYYYVDRARVPEDSSDYRIYVGLKGRVTAYPAELLASDAQGEIFSFGGSKLMISPRNQKAEVRHGGAARELVYLDIGDHARFVYSDFGAYAGEQLGTPCDGRF